MKNTYSVILIIFFLVSVSVQAQFQENRDTLVSYVNYFIYKDGNVQTFEPAMRDDLKIKRLQPLNEFSAIATLEVLKGMNRWNVIIMELIWKEVGFVRVNFMLGDSVEEIRDSYIRYYMPSLPESDEYYYQQYIINYAIIASEGEVKKFQNYIVNEIGALGKRARWNGFLDVQSSTEKATWFNYPFITLRYKNYFQYLCNDIHLHCNIKINEDDFLRNMQFKETIYDMKTALVYHNKIIQYFYRLGYYDAVIDSVRLNYRRRIYEHLSTTPYKSYYNYVNMNVWLSTGEQYTFNGYIISGNKQATVSTLLKQTEMRIGEKYSWEKLQNDMYTIQQYYLMTLQHPAKISYTVFNDWLMKSVRISLVINDS